MERVKLWWERYRQRYRLYQLKDNYQRQRLSLEEMLSIRATLYKQLEIEISRNQALSQLIYIRTTNAWDLLAVLQKVITNLETEQELKFGHHRVADQNGDCSLYDWLYVPLAKNSMSVIDYLDRCNHYYNRIRNLTEDDEATYGYIHRQLSYFTEDLLTALSVVEELTLN